MGTPTGSEGGQGEPGRSAAGGGTALAATPQWAYRRTPPGSPKPRLSPELFALVAKHAPGEVSSLLQGPRLQRVLLDRNDNRQAEPATPAAQLKENHEELPLEVMAEVGVPTTPITEKVPQSPPPEQPSPRSVKPTDVVARERQEKLRAEQQKEARKQQQLSFLAKVKRQQAARARQQKAQSAQRQREEAERAEAEALEAVKAAEAAALAAEKWRKEKDAQRRAAKAAAAKVAATEAAKSPQKGKPTGDEVSDAEKGKARAYVKPWQSGMKRKAKEEAKGEAGLPDGSKVSRGEASSVVDEPSMANAGSAAAAGSTTPHAGSGGLPGGRGREGVSLWMERMRRERAAQRQQQRADAAMRNLQKKAAVRRVVTHGSKVIKRSASKSGPFRPESKWVDDVTIAGTDEEGNGGVVQVTRVAGQGSGTPIKSILKKEGMSVAKLAVPKEIVSQPPPDGASFDPPLIDTTFGEWAEELAPHLIGSPLAGFTDPMRNYGMSPSLESVSSQRRRVQFLVDAKGGEEEADVPEEGTEKSDASGQGSGSGGQA
eukprot:CAMPEP_0117681530 /NCGR_PEP_ID=MMETSP0804-20121206/19041_1 /TAXON_ID=1074897 /ORGANISM="Tetraselmis astigmatica, Strain CCMP880" /LENGTH=543 /DNA_ID=CAMNT_0005491313 /DNA_START=121 /DNA_END=1748 /DNA_ORIENTATION=+